MLDSVLVVCIGNICRSPLGEALFKRDFPNFKVASAGLGAMVGWGAAENSQQVARQHGLSLEQHVAQQLTAPICNDFELILVMESWHVEKVCKIAPVARGKTMLFGKWLNNRTIPDPYKKDIAEFEKVYELLEQAMQGWQRFLR